MPDDDYEPRAKYYDEETRPEVIDKMEKIKQIKALLDEAASYSAWASGPAEKNIIKVLRLMLDIE